MEDLKLKNKIDAYIDAHQADYVSLLFAIASLPSPTGNEAKKAAFILKTLKDMGAETAHLDAVGNVVYPYQLEKAKEKPLLYTAHMDTVFEGVDEIVPEIDGHIMKAPSIGDNSSNVAALLFLIRMFHELKLQVPAIFCFNVGEEGLGNLRGAHHLMETWQEKIRAFIAVDGDSERFVNEAVGSHRYAVHVVTPGGHSFANFGEKNAIAAASAIIEEFYGPVSYTHLTLPTTSRRQRQMCIRDSHTPKTTYNVGTIQGGRTVNAIAADVEFTVDMRSVSMTELQKLDAAFMDILKRHEATDVTLETLLLGKRPCGDGPLRDEIYERIMRIRRREGKMTKWAASSTDANIALSRGLPAMAFGVGHEKGVHTLDEELDLSSLAPGLKQLASFILDI